MNARTLSIARSFAVIGATGALILGATFAAGSVGTVSLTGNTLSAQAGLQIAPDNSGAPGIFSTSVTGFNFGSLVPNANASSHGVFWMKNTTGVDVTLSELAANVTGFNNMDKSKVIVHVKATGGTDTTDNLAHLAATGMGLTDTVPSNGNATKFEVWTSLDTGALNTGSVTSTGGFDLSFTASTP